MKSQIAVSLAIVFFCRFFSAQEAGKAGAPSAQGPAQGPAAAAIIRVTRSARTQFTGPAFNRVTCDMRGNIFARHREPGDKSYGHVQEIQANGTLGRSFILQGPILDLSIADFAIGPNDELYMVGWSTEHVHAGGRVYIARFNKEGMLKSKIQISSDEFFPSSLAVFQSGEILITGTQGRHDEKPFTGVFAADGTLIAKVYEPEDEDLRLLAEAGDPSVHESGVYGNTAVNLGTAVTGSDGNVYVARRTSPALIYVISPKGKVIRKLQIGARNGSSLPDQLQSSPGALAISLQDGNSARVVKVVDLQGNDIGEYDVDQSLPAGSLACYGSGAFTFLTVDPQDLHGYLHITELRKE